MFVVPAKAGTQRLENPQSHWVPVFAGTTDSVALNFKESFNIATELLRGISVDRFFSDSSALSRKRFTTAKLVNDGYEGCDFPRESICKICS